MKLETILRCEIKMRIRTIKLKTLFIVVLCGILIISIFPTNIRNYHILRNPTDSINQNKQPTPALQKEENTTNCLDTGPSINPYPSIMGIHTGTISPEYTFNITQMYTYPCADTSGHSKYVRLFGNGLDTEATWDGFSEGSDYHYITFDEPFVLEASHTYNYIIKTGSYPQIHHNSTIEKEWGNITCTNFIDVNGKDYESWIPAIRFEGTIIGSEYIVEDFNDMVTTADKGFNDFSGNMGLLNKDDIEYITDFEINTTSHNEQDGCLQLDYDFTIGADPEAFTGIFMSLFGLSELTTTFDGKTNETLEFSNYAIDFTNIFGALQQSSPKDFDALKIEVKGSPKNEKEIILRIELKDNNGGMAYVRCTIPNQQKQWEEIEFSFDSFNNFSSLDLHHIKYLNFIIERNHQVDNIHNPDTGLIYLDNIRFVDYDQKPVNIDDLTDDQFLDLISKRTFQYFLDWASKDPRSKGIIQDRSNTNDLLTIGGTGFALTAILIAIERGWISREDGRTRVKDTLEILGDDDLQGPEPIGKIGYKGFFYHFLGIDGKRKINYNYPETPENETLSTVELSTIDTALCLFGVLTCLEYFDESHADEATIRNLAEHIYERVEWDFMLEPSSNQFYLGWKPNEQRSGSDFEIPDDDNLGCYSGTSGNPQTLDYYTDEAQLVSLLAIGSPTNSTSVNSYYAWIRETDEGDFVKTYPGSLFTYFFASIWVNFKTVGADNGDPQTNWYVNSQEAILTDREYCISKATTYSTYGQNAWGLTACDGPDDIYRAYGSSACALNVNNNPFEDGTIAPYGAGSVITFGEEIANYSIAALRHYYKNTDLWRKRFGFADAYNLDISNVEGIGGSNIIRETGTWYNHVGFAIDNGPLLIALENYRSNLIWNLMAENSYLSSAIDEVYNYANISIECENSDEATVGMEIWRSNASNDKVHGTFGCESTSPYSAKSGYVKYYLPELPETNQLYIVIRYSKDSSSTTPIKIFIDEEVTARESFIPQDQGNWNSFDETELIKLGAITQGFHNITFSTDGQQYGVADLDKFTLFYYNDSLLKPLPRKLRTIDLQKMSLLLGPEITNITYSPDEPTNIDELEISCRAFDSLNISTLTLSYSPNNSGNNWNNLTMENYEQNYFRTIIPQQIDASAIRFKIIGNNSQDAVQVSSVFTIELVITSPPSTTTPPPTETTPSNGGTSTNNGGSNNWLIWVVAIVFLIIGGGIVFIYKYRTDSKEKTITDKAEKKEHSEKITVAPKTEDTRCMVSGIPLDFTKHKIVSCPKCGHLARHKILAEWLKVKGKCPVCQERIKIEDCERIT